MQHRERVRTQFMVEAAMDACIEKRILKDFLISEKAWKKDA